METDRHSGEPEGDAKPVVMSLAAPSLEGMLNPIGAPNITWGLKEPIGMGTGRHSSICAHSQSVEPPRAGTLRTLRPVGTSAWGKGDHKKPVQPPQIR